MRLNINPQKKNNLKLNVNSSNAPMKIKMQINNEKKVENIMNNNDFKMKPLTEKHANDLYKLDCEYAAYELALRDPNSEASKRKAKLDKLMASL